MTKSITAQSSIDGDHEATAKGLSFLQLPPEIRNKIYRYALVEVPSAMRIEGLVQPPLTRTSRQVRSEALPIYYGNNRFKITIPPRQPLYKHDSWADFIRMFRVFKAGRIGGRPGTSNLRFLRDLSCLQTCTKTRESFWDLEVVFKQPAKSGAGKHQGCGAWEKRLVYTPKRPRLLKVRDSACKSVGRALGDDTVLLETCVQRLISTVVMIATECPGAIKEVHFHSDRRWEEDEYGSE